jgi:hypothetical protein
VVNEFEKLVTCTSDLAAVICCIDEVKAQYDREPFSNQGKAAKAKLDSITTTLYLAIIKEKSGRDCSAEVSEIKKALNCDCGCGSDAVEARPLIGQGLTGVNVDMVGTNAASATSVITGGTKRFTVNVKNVQATKGNPADLAFSITKIEDATTISYAIAFDNAKLAANILDAIETDDQLTQALRNIVAATNTGISLDGLNNSCVITLGNCSYSLIEQTAGVRTINSVTIAGTTYNAPANLSISNSSGILTWLNGLGKGTFTAALDTESGTMMISSANNPNRITQLSLNISGQTVLRQFNRNCISLIDVLNAITTYVCALDATKVKFGVLGKTIPSFNTDGSIAYTNIDPAATLGSVITQILSATSALFTKINNIAISCANMNALFTASNDTVHDTDVLYGTKDGVCHRITMDDITAAILGSLSTNAELKSVLCALVASCEVAVCSPVTNLSASLASGTLTVNCNDASPSTSLEIGYRVNNSGGTFSILSVNAGDLPKAITGLTGSQYEVRMRKLCTTGQYSSYQYAITQACTAPVSFSLSRTSTNLVIAATLSGSQTKFDYELTDPNGGVTTGTHDFSAVSGTFNVAIPDVALFGNYTMRIRAVCNDSSTPRFVSAYTAPAVVNYPNPGGGGDDSGGGPSYTRLAVQMATTSGAVCAAAPQYVYVGPSITDINHTVVVYYDSALTTVVNDKSYITDSSGRIFQINSSGVVGTLTGSSCTGGA